MFSVGLRGSGAERNSAIPWMFFLWMRRARCHWPMFWRVRRLERSLVLLGDPQQLEQPQKGSHPEGSDISALAHLLDGGRTISETQGLFLAETWRLHPAICSFTSELFYEGRLFSHSMVLSDRISRRPRPSRARVCGLCLSSMMATRAIRRKRSSRSPQSLNS